MDKMKKSLAVILRKVKKPSINSCNAVPSNPEWNSFKPIVKKPQ